MFFKVVIAGRTPAELRQNIQDYLSGMDDSNKTVEVSQPEFSKADIPTTRTASATEAIEQHNFTSPHIAPNDPVHFIAPPPPAMPAIPDALTYAAAPNAVVKKSKSKSTGDFMEFGVDSRGIPWDERIHAVTQAVNSDGTWRNRRSVDRNLVDQVEAELRQKVAEHNAQMGATAATPPSAPVMASPTYPAPSLVHSAPAVPQVPQTPVQLSPVVQSIAPPLPSAHTFETFKARLPEVLTRLVEQKALSEEYIATLKAHFGVDQIWKVNDQQLNEMFEGFAAAKIIAKVM